MGQNAKPWTLAIDEFLRDGEWHSVEDALTVGASLVPAERALQEMGSRQQSQPEERRVAIGKRNVAMQAITGRVRFLRYEFGEGKKSIRLLANSASSPGELRSKVEELTVKVEELTSQIDSMQAQLDRLDAESESRATERSLLVAAGSADVSSS